MLGTMNTPSRSDLLAQLAQINLMERGSLSQRSFKDRSTDAPAQFKLQSWEHGKNYTRHVTSEQLPLVRKAIEGYAKFQDLTTQLADTIIAQTREQLQSLRHNSKKRTHPTGPHRPRPRNRAPDRVVCLGTTRRE